YCPRASWRPGPDMARLISGGKCAKADQRLQDVSQFEPYGRCKNDGRSTDRAAFRHLVRAWRRRSAGAKSHFRDRLLWPFLLRTGWPYSLLIPGQRQSGYLDNECGRQRAETIDG